MCRLIENTTHLDAQKAYRLPKTSITQVACQQFSIAKRKFCTNFSISTLPVLAVYPLFYAGPAPRWTSASYPVYISILGKAHSSKRQPVNFQ